MLDVPLLIRFPRGSTGRYGGAPRIEGKTLHRDLIGWLAHYLNGGPLFLDGFHGNQSWENRRRSHLSAYASPGRAQTYTMLSVSRANHPEIRARITLRTANPTARLLGFEQEFGLPAPAPSLDSATSNAIVSAFERELELFSR